MVLAEADELTGSDVFMDMVTVGGTINVMLAASRAKGITTIYNAAKEPHIVDLANFLNSMGCRVKGAGTGCHPPSAVWIRAMPPALRRHSGSG